MKLILKNRLAHTNISLDIKEILTHYIMGIQNNPFNAVDPSSFAFPDQLLVNARRIRVNGMTNQDMAAQLHSFRSLRVCLILANVPLEIATRMDNVAFRLCNALLKLFFHHQLDLDRNYRPFRKEFSRPLPGHRARPSYDGEYAAIYEIFSQVWNSRQFEIIDISDSDDNDEENKDDDTDDDDNNDHDGFEWKEPEGDSDDEGKEEENDEMIIEEPSPSPSYSFSYDTSRCSYTFGGYGTEEAEFAVLNATIDPSVYLRGSTICHMPLKYDEYSYLYEYEVYNTRVKISMPDDPTILKKKKKIYVKENKNRARAAQFQRNRMAIILDTGSQIHLFYDSRFLRNMRSTRRRILDVNGGAVEIDTEGDIGLLQNVLVSTRSPRNIISGTLLMQMGLHFYTTGDYLFICDKDNNFVSMGRRNKNNLIYMRDMNLLRDDIRDELVLVAREDTTDVRRAKERFMPQSVEESGVNVLNLLHNRFGHLPEKKLKAIAKNGSIKGLGICFEDIKDLHIDVCDACIRAKMRKLPVKPSQSNNNEERKPFEKVGADIIGKVQVKSIHGNHYFVFYVDYKTNYTVAYFIAKKNELLNTLEELEADYIKFYGHELKVLQSDSEAVFKDEKIANWCRKRNVRTHLSPPYLHEANGKAERNIQTIVEMARTYMLSSNAPPNVWEYAVALAVHNLNLTPRSSLNWKSPRELVTGEVPDISHLIPFYAKGWAYKYKDEPDARQFKFGELASNVRFLGYSKSSRNAFIVKTVNGKIMLRRDCQFDEHPLGPEDIPEKTPLDNHKELNETDSRNETQRKNKRKVLPKTVAVFSNFPQYSSTKRKKETRKIWNLCWMLNILYSFQVKVF
jgi:hypothetical protein